MRLTSEQRAEPCRHCPHTRGQHFYSSRPPPSGDCLALAITQEGGPLLSCGCPGYEVPAAAEPEADDEPAKVTPWTPGPWLVDDGNGDGPLGISDRQGQRIAYLSEYGGRAVDWERPAETDKANARLMAAAPEMYEAHAKHLAEAERALEALPRWRDLKPATESGVLAAALIDAMATVETALQFIRDSSRAALAKAAGK